MAFATSSGLGDGGGVSPVPLIGRCTDREGVCTVPYPCCWCMVLGGDINVPSCTVGMLEAANRASSSRIRSSMWVSVTAVVPGDGGWGKTLPLLVSLSLRMRGVGRRRCSLVSPEGRDFSLGVRLVGNALVVSCLVSCLVSGEGKLGLALFVGEWMPLGLGWAAARCFMSKMSKNNRAWVLWGDVPWCNFIPLYTLTWKTGGGQRESPRIRIFFLQEFSFTSSYTCRCKQFSTPHQPLCVENPLIWTDST